MFIAGGWSLVDSEGNHKFENFIREVERPTSWHNDTAANPLPQFARLAKEKATVNATNRQGCYVSRI